MTTAPIAFSQQAALQRAGDALTRAEQAMLAGELEAMLPALEEGLDVLSDLARQGLVAQQQKAPQPPWDADRMAQAVWSVLARLKQAGCSVFPFAGTLLGLQRDGRLLPNDKDADFGVWLEDFNLACRLMQGLGLQRAGNVPPFGNMASLVDPRSGLSVDLFGIRREPEHQRLVGGVWLYGKPASHQRINHYPWLTLAPRMGPAGEVWWPDPPEALLEALYGDWRTPVPEWDSLISCVAVQHVNLQWRCWALKNLADRWLTGDLARTRRLLDQITARAGLDASLLRWRDALDAALAQAPGKSA